ncbi:hypothetical protein VTO42DRAFT_5657 [Malbranchea cinnamomea]
MVRSGVWLEKSVVPYIGSYTEGEPPLNAYLYDFFKHGNVRALETDNGIRKGDIWYLLNDFSGERHEEELDDNAIQAELGAAVEHTPMSVALMERPMQVPSIASKAALTGQNSKVADSWEDSMSEDDDAVTASFGTKPGIAKQQQQMVHTKPSHREIELLQQEFDEKFKKTWA